MTKVRKMPAVVSKEEKKVLANIDNFPHLKNIKESIEKLKNYCDLLEKRKLYARENYETLPAKDKVEVDILIIETDTKIARSRQRIDERNQYFNDYVKKLSETFDDVMKNYDQTRKDAILKSRDKKFHNAEALKNELDEANNFASHFQTNWELKFRHYLELRKLLTASPAAKPEDLQDVDVTLVNND